MNICNNFTCFTINAHTICISLMTRWFCGLTDCSSHGWNTGCKYLFLSRHIVFVPISMYSKWFTYCLPELIDKVTHSKRSHQDSHTVNSRWWTMHCFYSIHVAFTTTAVVSGVEWAPPANLLAAVTRINDMRTKLDWQTHTTNGGRYVSATLRNITTHDTKWSIMDRNNKINK